MLVTAAFLIALGYTSLASAHFIFAQQTAPTGGVDWFSVNCPATTSFFEARVNDFGADNDFLTATVFKGAAASGTDPNGGDAPGPFARVTNGVGVYNIMITHSGTASTQTYFVQFHCRRANNSEPDPIADPNTGEDFTVIQDDN